MKKTKKQKTDILRINSILKLLWSHFKSRISNPDSASDTELQGHRRSRISHDTFFIKEPCENTANAAATSERSTHVNNIWNRFSK